LFLLRDLVFNFDLTEAEPHIDEWLAEAATDPASGWTAEELATHLQQEYSTFSWLLEPMLEAAGFEIVERDLPHFAFSVYLCRRSAMTTYQPDR
jgi:hypothetical protein